MGDIRREIEINIQRTADLCDTRVRVIRLFQFLLGRLFFERSAIAPLALDWSSLTYPIDFAAKSHTLIVYLESGLNDSIRVAGPAYTTLRYPCWIDVKW